MTERRVRLWLRVVSILLLPLAAYSAWDYVESRRLESRLNAIQQRGEPTTHPYQLPEGDADLAGRLYRAAGALTSFPRQSSIELRNRVGQAWRTGHWTDEGALEGAALDVAGNREALEFADRAAKLPFVGFGGGTSYNYQVSELLQLARLCELRAAVLASRRNGDGAVASFVTEVRLLRTLESMTTPLG